MPTLITYRALGEEGIAAGLPAAWAPKIAEVSHAGLNALRLAHRAGVKIAFGTDLLGTMQRRQLEEFAIRAEVQSPIDIIRAATVTAAALFRLSGEIGTVAPGKRADLIVIEGDPLADVAALQNPDKYLKAIIRGGQVVKADACLT